jgi:hypothetical protein
VGAGCGDAHCLGAGLRRARRRVRVTKSSSDLSA